MNFAPSAAFLLLVFHRFSRVASNPVMYASVQQGRMPFFTSAKHLQRKLLHELCKTVKWERKRRREVIERVEKSVDLWVRVCVVVA